VSGDWGDALWEGMEPEPDTTTPVVDNVPALPMASEFGTPPASDADFVKGMDPAELFDYANKAYDKHVGDEVDAVWQIGTALNAARPHFSKGEWIPHVEDNFHGTRQLANRWQNIAAWLGDSPSNVTHLVTNDDGTPMEHPSINAVLKAMRKSKKDPKPPKSSVLLNRWLKRMDALAEEGMELYKHLPATATEAKEVGYRVRDNIDAFQELDDLVADIAEPTDELTSPRLNRWLKQLDAVVEEAHLEMRQHLPVTKSQAEMVSNKVMSAIGELQDLCLDIAQAADEDDDDADGIGAAS
jgi:hypothetical protein